MRARMRSRRLGRRLTEAACSSARRYLAPRCQGIEGTKRARFAPSQPRRAAGTDHASARLVRHPPPRRLWRQLHRLAVAVGLDVAEGLGDGVELDVELAFLDALVQPGRAEHE